MEKVIRDGKVAVLYSPGYGAGWVSWHNELALVFHPVLVNLVLQGRRDEITDEIVAGILNIPKEEVPYIGGKSALAVAWLPQGALFQIEEYDGGESIILESEFDWFRA